MDDDRDRVDRSRKFLLTDVRVARRQTDCGIAREGDHARVVGGASIGACARACATFAGVLSARFARERRLSASVVRATVFFYRRARYRGARVMIRETHCFVSRAC